MSIDWTDLELLTLTINSRKMAGLKFPNLLDRFLHWKTYEDTSHCFGSRDLGAQVPAKWLVLWPGANVLKRSSASCPLRVAIAASISCLRPCFTQCAFRYALSTLQLPLALETSWLCHILVHFACCTHSSHICLSH